MIKKILGFLGVVIGFCGVVLLLIMYGVVAWGVVVNCFWDWYIQPVFPSLSTITFVEAIGLSLVIGLFRNHNVPQLKRQLLHNHEAHQAMIWLSPWIVLLFGWIVHLIFF